MRKIVKKAFFATMIGTTLLSSLTGCKKDKEINVDANVSEDTKLALTDDEIMEYIKNNQDILNQEISESEEDNISSDSQVPSQLEREEMARKSYEVYKEFYDAIGVNQENVNTIVDIIYGDCKGYTQTEIQKALTQVQYMLYSDNLSQAIDNCNAIKIGSEIEIDNQDNFNPDTYEYYILPCPKISEFLENREIPGIDIIQNYEKLREEFIDEFKETGTYSEEMAKKLTDALIKLEEGEYDSYIGQMDSSLNNEGIEFVITASKLSLCNLAIGVNYNNTFVEGKNGKKYQLRARSDVNELGYIESDCFALRTQLERKGMDIPEDLALKITETENKLVTTKYLNGLCTLTDQMLTKAGYTDTSMLNLQEKQQKLKSLLEQCMFYKEMESVLAENSKLEGCRLTLRM